MDFAAKLIKSFEKIIIEELLLYMVVPRRINFTQLGRYGKHGKQCYRQNFGRLRSKSLSLLRFNVSLALRYFGSDGLKAMPLIRATLARWAGRLCILVVSGRVVVVL